ncbi:MAG: hypothetical protein QNJ97_16220 [Myxococcota bacterium]|nr:hypothetical protein [Myxococcota bacterium]
MGRRIRTFEPHKVYAVVIRTVDQQFLLKPDHNSKHPLLTSGCPVEAFNRFHEKIPDPSIIDVIGVAAARAKELAPINIHWVESNINHLHVGFSVTPEQLSNIAPFFRNFFSYIAVKLNKKWKRNGHAFGASYRATVCLDDVSVEQQMIYAITNPVKDFLVEKVSESPFFTTFHHLAQGGVKLRYFRIDWDGYHLAGSHRKKSHCPQDYVQWYDLEITSIPGQANWPDHKRQAWIRAQVRAVEERVQEMLRKKGRRAMGLAAQYAANPRARPAHQKATGGQPLCHCSDPEQRKAFERHWRGILSEYRKASIDYRMGMWDRAFPEGTYRPPLIKPYLDAYF